MTNLWRRKMKPYYVHLTSQAAAMLLLLRLPAAEQPKALRRAVKQGSIKVRSGRALLSVRR